jgi:pentatricopeptide repeat domain-containing protein 1
MEQRKSTLARVLRKMARRRTAVVAFGLLAVAILPTHTEGTKILSIMKPISASLPSIDAPIGNTPYGESITAPLYYAGDCCSETAVSPSVVTLLGDDFVVMADRGGACSLSTKAMHAQNSGAKAIIFSDNTDEPLTVSEGFYMKPTHQNANELPDMGSQTENLTIPCVITDQKSGTMLKSQDAPVVQLDWTSEHRSEVVRWQLWDSTYDNHFSGLSEHRSLMVQLAKIALALGKSTEFTPRYFLVPGDRWFESGEEVDCVADYGVNKHSATCDAQCTNRGRYCLASPDSETVTGKDLVQEDLRQMCVHRWATAQNQAGLWWRYIVKLGEECSKASRTSECSFAAMAKLRIDGDAIARCVQESGGHGRDDNENSLYEQEIKFGKSLGLMSVPRVFINEQPYWGRLHCPEPIHPSTCGLFAKICSAFEEGQAPAVCHGSVDNKPTHHEIIKYNEITALSLRGGSVARPNKDQSRLVVFVTGCMLLAMSVFASIGVMVRNRKSKKGKHHAFDSDFERGFQMAKANKMNAREYTKTIGLLAKQGKWEDALECLETMVQEGLKPDAFHYAGVLTALAKAKQGQLALDLLNKMQMKGTTPDVWTYNCAISACEKSGMWEKAVYLLESMQKKGLVPDVVSYSTTISACGKGHKWEKSLELLDAMQTRHKLQPDLVTYNAVISSCEKVGQWEKALELLGMLCKQRRKGLKPDVISYNATISACEKGAQWQQAVQLLGMMEEHNVIADVISYNATISACEKAGQWKKALEILEQMRDVNGRTPAPDLISFNAAISACEKGCQWQKALSLLSYVESPSSGLAPDVVTYNAAISSCEQGGQWEKAVELLGRMQNKEIHPTVVSFSAAISACAACGKWRKGIELMAQMDRCDIAADVIAYRAAIVACGKAGQWTEAERLYSKATKDGLMSQCDESADKMTLELSGSPAAVVVAALRHTLIQLSQRHPCTSEVQDLYIKSDKKPEASKNDKMMRFSPVTRIELDEILKKMNPHPLSAEKVSDSCWRVPKAELQCWLDKFQQEMHFAPVAIM